MANLKDKLGFFTAMPERVIELTPEIGSDAVFIYLYLRYMTNKERGCAWPSYTKIRNDTGWGKQRISNSLKTLVENKLLVKRKRFGQSTEYILPKPPDVGGAIDDTPSSTGAGLVRESDSSTVAEPSVVPERDKVLKTELKQTDIKDSRPNNGRTRKQSLKDKTRKTVEEYFSSKTGLKVPDPKTAPQKKKAGAMWYAPIRAICDAVDWNLIKTKGVIDMTLDRLDGMTIANPNSIVKTAIAIIAEEKIGKGTVRQKEPHEMTKAEFSAYLKESS